MNRLFIVLIATLTMCGCKTKVFWLPGTLETGGVSDRCEMLPELSSFLEYKADLNQLVEFSLHEQDPVRLHELAEMISIKAKSLESMLAPEISKTLYPVVYRFRVREDHVRPGSGLLLRDFSISGYRLLSDGIHVEKKAGYWEIILARQATLLEICSLTGTAQGLYAVAEPDGDPEFYYRLYVKDVK